MARVFLLNPPTAEPVRTPLLALAYLGAALRAQGHVVALLDGAAPCGVVDPAQIAARVSAFAPDLLGLHLKTLAAQDAYALVAALRPHLPASLPLVAGGPHATVCPEEPLRHGFTYVIRGEGEEALPQLAAALAGQRRLEQVTGLTYRGALGLRHNPGAFLSDLDALPSPLDALDLFEGAWYGPGAGRSAPCGLLSSRGCPAACTFCCNNVTGRRFRYRSAEAVADEVARLQREFGLSAFSFFDDSFAVGRRRIEALCLALRTRARGVTWTCTAHPAHLDREVLREMKLAGCGGVDLGIESGDAEMLLRIGKGVTTARVLQVLGWARELGLHTVVNLMFGWPDETREQLEATLAFMEESADLAGGFNARGVVVPYPGTEIYEENHGRFGFTEWWLREPPLIYEPFPSAWSLAEVSRAYAADAALTRNFFQHPAEVVALIERALRRKAELTFRTVAHLSETAPRVPAAGAR